MNMLAQINTGNKMTNIDLLEVINTARLNYSEKPVRLNDFNSRIIDELDGEYYETFVVQNLNNTSSQGFNLSIDQCILIGMRESKAVRKNVLSILNRKQAPKLPQSFSEALQLAADQARQLEIAAPKVQYFDAVVERSTLLNATQVAQKLRMSAMAMNKLLDALDVYSHGVKRARVFKQWFIDKGLGELKQTDLGYSQPMFTTRGEAWVIERLVSEGVVV